MLNVRRKTEIEKEKEHDDVITTETGKRGASTGSWL